ncbi:MAG: hypothetical protein GF411_14645 [Candidatus Lokiarchaeota archaeon]|nr:hypothetical protein [Candidatus Lokiarchaeota archaeon]
MYVLKDVHDEENRFQGVEIRVNGQLAAALTGGLAILISTAYANYMERLGGETRADAFLFGIVTALNHCTLTGSIPSVTDGRSPEPDEDA